MFGVGRESWRLEDGRKGSRNAGGVSRAPFSESLVLWDSLERPCVYWLVVVSVPVLSTDQLIFFRAGTKPLAPKVGTGAHWVLC